MPVYAYRKLRATLDEYTTRVGQQAIVLCISPSKPNPVFKVFGAAPLENVVSVRVSRLTTSAAQLQHATFLPNIFLLGEDNLANQKNCIHYFIH